MWALMAIWAVNRTISLNNDDCASCAQSPDLSTEFLWGRVGTIQYRNPSLVNLPLPPVLDFSVQYVQVDCATAPYTTADVGLPSALLHNTGLTSFFRYAVQPHSYQPLGMD